MKMKKILILLFFAVAIIGIIAPINAAESSVSSEDKVYSIESKNKAASLKITWNANGGKIGTKKNFVSTVKKGSTLNKLAASPKRSGYLFKGWYSKKTGGTKITKNTKPSKSVSYYAQWKKGSSRILTAEEKKLVGTWSTLRVTGSVHDYKTGSYQYPTGNGVVYTFAADGTYSSITIINTFSLNDVNAMDGSWRLSGGTLYLTNKLFSTSNNGGKTFSSPVKSQDSSFKIRIGSDEGGQYFTEIMSGGTESFKRYKG